ncbi:MAG: DNA polymerase [Planctomycetota bacterium]
MHYPARGNQRLATPPASHAVNWLFLDMNAFFASVEQQRRPELRGRPVAVVPTMTDATCCIAASYESRPFGVKTGVNVGEARRRCPELQLVEGRHEHYIEAHHQILAAVRTVLPLEDGDVMSIDEMACRLSPPDRWPERAREKALAVKRAIREQVGPYLRCSVGLAPNRFLAKTASNFDKPDGLTTILRSQLPYRLHQLELTDLTGIGRNMERRLVHRGVTSVRQLCALSKPALRELWGSVVGDAWWHKLRGDDVAEKETRRQTIGHSHVLPPDLRTDDGAFAVLVRLLHKAAARLRKENFSARQMEVSIRYTRDRYGGGTVHERPPDWSAKLPLGPTCRDTPTMLKAMHAAWRRRPAGGVPLQAGVTLMRIEPVVGVTAPLFEEDRRALRAAQTMDAVNLKVGPNALYFASMHDTRESAPMRIAFTRIPDLDSEMGG